MLHLIVYFHSYVWYIAVTKGAADRRSARKKMAYSRFILDDGRLFSFTEIVPGYQTGESKAHDLD